MDGVGSGFTAPALRGVSLAPQPLFRHAIGTLALPRLAAGEGVAARDAAPIYLRHKVALTSAERAVGRAR